jgi:NhaA family Na+:H+ antiporter
MFAAVLALVCVNTPLYSYYALFVDTSVAIQVGAFEIEKPLLLWINDGLMTIFFFLIGLELKREVLEGEFSDRRKIILPAIGAIILIATLYTANLSVLSLVVAALCILALAWLNRRNPESTSLFLLIGVVMWSALLKSGVHATLAGIILAIFIPVTSKTNANHSPLKCIEQ